MNIKIIAIALAIASAASIPASAADAPGDGANVEEMKREIRQLRSQVQALQSALTDLAELHRQSTDITARALKGAPPPPAVSSDEAPSLPEPAAREEAPRRGEGKAGGKGQPARRREVPMAAAPAVGVVRGKVEVPKGEPIAYAYVENVFASPVKNEKVVVEQRDKQFVPSWAVVQRGTTIVFPNLDKVYHNVFSLSSGNSFDLGLYNAAGEPKAHTFNEAGAVDVFCNIHPQMAANMLVVPNRHFAKVKADGTFEINNVPSGKRKIVVWSPGSRLTTQWVELDGGGVAEVDMKLEPKARGHKNKQNRAYGSYE
ncbi:MAG: hypothetical protein SF187_26370 [Deltaproteobacteria bacterium]|nr:hypothetical protein [Deltaproteobacteria bacterium]